jgi:microcystin-dependent protein
MAGFQQVDVARNQFDSKGLELAIQSMTQNLNNFYSTGTINEIGAIVAYGGTLPPTGFLLCDGSAVSRVTFSALFAVLGTTYGAGDGSTTFNLPNLKGRVPVGLDTSQTEFDVLGETGGHKLLQAHTHNVVYTPGSGNLGLNPGATGYKLTWTSGGDQSISTVSTGGGNAQNLQPYQVVNYIIRYALPVGANTTEIPCAFRAYGSGTQSTAVTNFTKITLGTAQYDIGTNYSTVNSRFTAPVAGIYHFDGAWYQTTGTNVSSFVSLFINGGERVRGTWLRGTMNYTQPTVSSDLYLAVGDYVELDAYTEGASATVQHNAYQTYLSGHLVKQLTV